MKVKSIFSATLLAVAVCGSGASFASDMYVLGSLGASQTDGSDSSGTAFKIQLGYQVSPNLAIEGGYVDAGTQKMRIGGYNVEGKTTGASVAMLGVAPLNDMFSVFAKLGYNSYTTKVTVGGYSGSGSGSTSGSLYGFGGTYKLNESVGIRAEYEKIASDASLTTVGVQYKF